MIDDEQVSRHEAVIASLSDLRIGLEQVYRGPPDYSDSGRLPRMIDAVPEPVAAAIETLPASLHAPVRRWFARLADSESLEGVKESLAAPLVRLVACSDYAANVVLREWQWLKTQAAEFDEPPSLFDLHEFAASIAASDEPVETVKGELRQFRHRYMLHVLWRELSGRVHVAETLRALSDLADSLLDAAARYSERQQTERFGSVRDADGDVVPIVILGMGKLGGWELNFSSDIDIIFLYPNAGSSDGERSLSAQEYFTRQARSIVALLDEVTAEGFVFRIDTRLRPFGDSGPAVVSFAALESYLLQHGRTWERYAYVKARVVGPKPSRRIVKELDEELIRPFVYRRYLDFGVFESLREMQALIATEVERRDLAMNIKRGPGGIREIEFIVQSLQLVRGGARPELQRRELLDVLPKLAGPRGLTAATTDDLRDAYCFLRRLENFLQALRDQQTHEIPDSVDDCARIALAMGYVDWNALAADLDRHRRLVAEHFNSIAFRAAESDSDDRLRQRFFEAWERNASIQRWRELFSDEGYPDSLELATLLNEFRNAPQTLQVDATASTRLDQFVPDLLVVCRKSMHPLRALRRTLAIAEKILRRSAYLALLNENRAATKSVVRLCENSRYIAEQLARHPMLLDELLDPRLYSYEISRADLEAELNERRQHCDDADSEAQMETLAQFQRGSMFRIAVADFSGSLPIMKISDALTELAETVLNRALDFAWQELTRDHGVPEYEENGCRKAAGFGVIGYGKLGGIELSYGSDLDLVFLHDSKGERQRTSGEKPLDNAVFFSRLVRRLVHYLTTQTGSGSLYEVDMRLRPDGRSGLLVTNIDAFERYQDENAWTWEHQALLRVRPVAGSAAIADEFARIRLETLSNRVRRDTLRADVAGMRRRMRDELDRSNSDWFDLKQGQGGIADIEFLVQFLVLANAKTHPDVMRYSDNIRQLETLGETDCLDYACAARLQDIYRAYRLRLHRLVLEELEARVPATEFRSEREFVQATWIAELGETDG